MDVKHVELNNVVFGYPSPNQPESHVELNVKGICNVPGVKGFKLFLYPKERTLQAPFFDTVHGTWVISQADNTLSGWIAALDKIPSNENVAVTLTLYPDGRYEVGCVRVLTNI